jgi:hypothetical protein
VGANDDQNNFLIQEVDEELRLDQYHRLWKHYSKYIIIAVVVVIFVVFGYQGWQEWRKFQSQRESTKFAIANELINKDKTDEGLIVLDKLANDGYTGFALMANMRRAELLADRGDIDAAAVIYDRIASSSIHALYRDLATIKMTLLKLDIDDSIVIEKRITPLNTISNPWRFSAIEILAIIAKKNGNTQRAIELYKQLAEDSKTPSGIRDRATEVLTILSPVADEAKG